MSHGLRWMQQRLEISPPLGTYSSGHNAFVFFAVVFFSAHTKSCDRTFTRTRVTSQLKCIRRRAEYIFNAVPVTSSSPIKRHTLQQLPSSTPGGGALAWDSQFSAGFIVNELQLRHLVLPVLCFTTQINSIAGVTDSTLYDAYVRPLYAAWWVPNCTYRLSLIQIASPQLCYL